jgi:F-type H+-transporting ATPase subunit delta
MTTEARADPLARGYAQALLTAAQAEECLERVENELYQFARAMETNTELRDRLVDPSADTAAKLGLVTDLLGARAHPQTVAAVAYLVQAGRARQLPAIADALAALAARSREQTVAEVRAALPLDDEQQRRLAAALEASTGQSVDFKVIVDPYVVGGLVVRLGDTVIDGTVTRRLADLRSQLISA